MKRGVAKYRIQNKDAAISWTKVATQTPGLEQRSNVQCQQCWDDAIRPGLKRGDWAVQEEESIRQMYQTLGPKYVHTVLGLGLQQARAPS